jgi:NADH-quinone oxidoreductase subunit J
MDLAKIVFIVTAALILASALQVVTTRNRVHAAIWLIASFFGMAVIFVLLGAGFLAAVQVVVYIGAISILIIFAIMLTRRVMQDTGSQTNRHLVAPAIAVAVVLLAAMLYVFGRAPFVLAGAPVPDDSLVTLGLQLSSADYYVAPLVVVGMLLAVGMIGSIAIARDDKD